MAWAIRRLSKGFPGRFNPGMSQHGQRILLVISLVVASINAQTSPCSNRILTNFTFAHIHSLNFFAGQSQPENISCSWIIHSPEGSVKSSYLLSFRVLDVQEDSSNELIFKSDDRYITFDDIHQRALLIPSSNLKIQYRPKSPTSHSTSLNIHRFLIELIHVHEHPDYFRCAKSGLLLPREWICNCISECLDGDFSDEENCPLCTLINSSDNLLCRSNEIWCLPSTTPANPVDSKGVCTSREQHPECSYATTEFQCDSILVYNDERGELVLDSSILSARSSLCFVIIAQQRHKIQLFINHYQTVHQPSDVDLLIYDGTDPQTQLFQSPLWLPIKYIVQTRDNHLVTVVIRRRSSLANASSQFKATEIDLASAGVNQFLLNITWLSSVCSDDQMLCSGQFERKCYSHQQRCDGSSMVGRNASVYRRSCLGSWDCVHGDDELGCAPQSCPTTFACNDPLPTSSDRPRCYTWSERCNGDPFCANRSDERFCSQWWCNSDNGTFLCKNLNCIYEVWMCDGKCRRRCISHRRT